MPHPIVLAHGIARFDVLVQELQKLGAVPEADGLHYFRNIKTFLESHGFTVFHTSVSFSARVEQRARELAVQIQGILAKGHEKVHIIGHSMGGLDARHMIVDIAGMAEKAASLTTIGTPHNGTSFADWGVGKGGDKIIRMLDPVLDLYGFTDLTSSACQDFNRRAMDAEATNPVVYQTYASHEEKRRVMLPLQASWQIIQDREGDNDGLVPVQSQSWRAELTAGNGTRKQVFQYHFPVPADHLNQVGWWDPREMLGLQARSGYETQIKNVYLEIVERISR